jgi:hypothetical protein
MAEGSGTHCGSWPVINTAPRIVSQLATLSDGNAKPWRDFHRANNAISPPHLPLGSKVGIGRPPLSGVPRSTIPHSRTGTYRLLSTQEMRQAYMKLLLEAVTVDHHSVRLEGSPAILEKLAARGPSMSSPEVLSFVREWRPREDSNLRSPV